MSAPDRKNKSYHADLDTPGFMSAEDKVKLDSLGVVSSLENLPDPQNGIIYLEEGSYSFRGTVDLQGNRLVCNGPVTILGDSSETTKILSTGLDSNTALLTTTHGIPIRFIAFEHNTALDLDASSNPEQAIDWIGVNFINSFNIGTIKGYTNAILESCAFLNSSGLVFDGTIGTVAFEGCLFECNPGGTLITLPASLTLTRRFRIIYSAFIVLSGETGVSASTSATIPTEGYIYDTVNFAGGGTYLAGITRTDNRSRFIECRGIENTSSIGVMTMNGNATATTISATGTPVKIAGTTALSAVSQRFSHANNRLTYDGALTRNFKVSVVGTLSSGNGHQIGTYVAKNGVVIDDSETYITTNASGRVENVSVQSVVNLEQNDYIEIFVENNTSITNITAESLSVIISTIE